MPRAVLAKTAGFSLVELTVVMAIIASLAALGLPTFVTYRDRSRVTQVIGSSEAIRAALASYAASSLQNAYPLDRRDHRFCLLAPCGEYARWYVAAECKLLGRPLRFL